MPVCASQHGTSSERTHRETIEEEVPDLLGLLLEDLEILKYHWIDLDGVDVANRVLAEEVERDLGGRRERDVLEAERAAANRVRLVLALLVSVPKREAVDEVDRSRPLTDRHLLVAQVDAVVRADAVDVLLELARLLELLHVRLTLKRRAGGEEHVSGTRISAARRGRGTHLTDWLMFSFHVASQVTLSSCTTSLQRWPAGASGILTPLLTLIVMSSGESRVWRRLASVGAAHGGRTLSSPVLGCSPRPRNRPGGSTRKLPTFSFLPSRRHVLYGSSSRSRVALITFLAADESDFLAAFSVSRCEWMGVKSQSSKVAMLVLSS